MITRRHMLAGLGGLATIAAGAPALATSTRIAMADLRGTLDAADFGIRPDGGSKGQRAFERLLKEASARRSQIFLPPGTYEIGGVTLPDFVRITGVAGATRLLYSGEGSFLKANGTYSLHMTNLVLDGANRWLSEESAGLLALDGVDDLRLEGCQISGSSKHALWAERCGGVISRNEITGAADAAIFAVQGAGLTIERNDISDCGNGGILVHRWTKGPDNSIVRANRISRILAKKGGTGENGNGINIFRADGVTVSDNHVAECAFSAIRSNAGSNVQILNNQCLSSGETAIYSEFGFEGAMIANNLVDGAANGILVVNFNEGGRLASVSGNIIRNLKLTGPYDDGETQFGMGISVEADTSVNGNIIENAPRWGMLLGWGPFMRNIVASGNLVRDAPVGCGVSVVAGVGSAVITSNIFDNTPLAIAGYEWLAQVTGDLTEAGADLPAGLVVSNNAVNAAKAG